MKEIEIPEGYKARIEGNEVVLEPKEGQDERIRKAIGVAICSMPAISILGANGTCLPDALAYLEKQKERKPADKPAEWSEEDEKIIDAIIRNLEYLRFDTVCSEITKENLEKRIKWLGRLKSLRPQPKQEWSEDERIRRNCIHFLELQKAHHADTSEIDECLAYLEKQKEKPELPGIDESGIPGKDYIPVEWVDTCEKYGKWRIIRQEQPAEWSKEDEKNWNEYIERLKSEYSKTPNVVLWDDINWLEDLHKRLNFLCPQPKQEWSEEDETCLEYALWCVMKTRHFVAKDACDLDACRCAERWLKALRLCGSSEKPKKTRKQEKPEVDLEKEYTTWWNSISGKINVEHIMEWYMHETARHFYELGLNARKEV